MADEFDDRMRQVFRDAASDAPRAQPLPAMIPVTSTRLRSTSGRRTLLAMAAGLLLVVGVGAAVLLRGDDPRIVPPVGTADVTTTAPSPTTSSSGASADVRPCATTDLRFAVRTSSLVVDGDARPLLNLTNIGEGTCVVDESLFLVFRDGDIARAGRRTEALELPSNPTGSPAFGGSMSLTFASICPEPGEFGQPVFDTLTARIGDGPTARIPLIGGECSTSPATCELDQLDASINDDHQFVLLNNSGRQCEVTVRDILFLRFDGVVQRAADLAGPDELRDRVVRLPPSGGPMIPLDDYCPRPLNGEQIVGAELVLDDYLTVDAAFIPEPEAITEPLCARSTDASAPAVPPCEPEAIATVVGNGEGAGQHDNQRLVLMNTGRYGDCVMPRDTTLTLTDAEGRPVEAPGPEGSFTGEPLRLEGDLVRAGAAAEMWVAYGTSTDDTSCLSGDGGAPVGPVTASIRLPGGDVVTTDSFDVLCGPSYTHLGQSAVNAE